MRRYEGKCESKERPLMYANKERYNNRNTVWKTERPDGRNNVRISTQETYCDTYEQLQNQDLPPPPRRCKTDPYIVLQKGQRSMINVMFSDGDVFDKYGKPTILNET